MKRRERRHSIAGAFVFLLLGVFAVFSTMLVLFGAQAYRTTAGISADHNETRVLYAFVLNAIRADDAAGAISVREVDGLDVLTVDYDYDGELYEKNIYCYDGSLRELFASVDFGFTPGDGERICPAQGFEASMEDGFITVKLTDTKGQVCEATVALRSGVA